MKKKIRNIPFYQPSIDNEELLAIKELFKNKHSKVEKFESSISKFIGVRYSIATCNATAALHLALSAMDIKRADKILMCVNSYVDIPETVRHFDAEPVFIDIEKDSMHIDLDKLETYLSKNNSKKLRAMIVSFVAGSIPNLKKLYEIKKRYNILLIENAMNGLGAIYKDDIIGSLGADMTIFSISPSNNNKPSISNAGIIVTNDEKLSFRAKLLRTHALTSFDENNDVLDYIYDVVDIGYRYDISDLEAAFNIVQLKKTNKFIKRRKEIASIYTKRLSNTKHIKIPVSDKGNIFTQYIIKIDRNRDSFARALKAKGIYTGLHFKPLHLLKYYKNKYGIKITTYPNALNSYQQILSLPIYQSLTDDDIEYICQNIIFIANEWI